MSNIKLFESKQIRSVWNEADKKWYFSVADVVGVLSESADPKAYWRQLKRREAELVTNCHGLKLTAADISRATFGTTPSEYKAFKSLDKTADNLRDHMTDLELIFTMLGEASTTEIARNQDAQGYDENHEAAVEGGTVAGRVRRDLEQKSGRRVSSTENYKAISEAVTRKRMKKKED